MAVTYWSKRTSNTKMCDIYDYSLNLHVCMYVCDSSNESISCAIAALMQHTALQTQRRQLTVVLEPQKCTRNNFASSLKFYTKCNKFSEHFDSYGA